MKIILFQYISFRCKQFFRLLKDIGIGHLILLAPILFVGVLGILQVILTSNNWMIAAFLLFSLVGNHWNRNDRFFLEQLSIPIFLIFYLDYIVLCSPFMICFIFWSKWQNLIVLNLGIFLLSMIKPPYYEAGNKKTSNFFTLKWIPLELFEWRSGLRKNRPLFLIAYGLGLGFSIYPITTPIFVFLMALGVTTFFQFFEHKDLLLAVNADKKLLQKKTLGSLKIFNLFMLPHYLLFIFFNPYPKYVGALVVVTLIAQLIIIFSIAMKYKTYSFHEHKVHNTLPLTIFVACWTFPFLWPVPIIMIFHFWRKAKKNLIYHYA